VKKRFLLWITFLAFTLGLIDWFVQNKKKAKRSTLNNARGFFQFSNVTAQILPDVNFANIVWAVFCAKKRFSQIFCTYTVCVCNFLAKGNRQKAARKMLMKLTSGVNLDNIKWAAFLYKAFFAAFVFLQFFCERN
jgi:ribose/xylose/arabinose/galactoside ABC-type transport system permease subunit